VTSSYACLGLWGPRARDILQPLTEADLSNEASSYMRAREIAVGGVPCVALRVTYVGELGWELYCPMEFGLRLWDTLWQAGRPDEAGLGFAVKLDKGCDFVGREALMAKKDRPLESVLACLVLDDSRSVALGEEPVRAGGEGEIVGRVTSGGYGYSVERSIAYAVLPASCAKPGQPIEVEIFGRWAPGSVAEEPLFDPGGERIRA
jgi:glycine cleavage system aminomethyltransferase T